MNLDEWLNEVQEEKDKEVPFEDTGKLDEITLTQWLNSIAFDKTDLMDRWDRETQYKPFIINKCLSAFIDTIAYVNEMNVNSHVDSKLQYDYFRNALRKRKRFSKWLRPDTLDSVKLDLIKEYYNYSTIKAREVLDLVDEEQVEKMQKSLYRG